jgi:hypothetical protein
MCTMKTRLIVSLLMLVSSLPHELGAEEGMRRFLLAVGANAGGSDRITLKYAVSDAERFADIMVAMGGVDAVDQIVLREPDARHLDMALSDLAGRIARVAPERRTEMVLYYSGHADTQGLRIGNGRLSYADLRARVDEMAAVVRITVLDACASGTITRLKGGERRQPFLVDVSSDMEGTAFLTSSAENESAQESDEIGASFFTHFLVSGLRGAADASGDGRVSLTEAYQFAFNETLARTTETLGGAQHPSVQVNLAGTGDVTMTDVRQTSAGLVLEKDLRGRFFIRDLDEHLVAELYKPRGRRVVLGLESGDYQVHLQRDDELFVARVDLGLEDLLVLLPDHFETAERSPAVARGDSGEWPPRPGFLGPLSGRSRIQLTVGMSGASLESETSPSGLVSTQVETDHLFLGLGYSRWIREDLALGGSVEVMSGDFGTDIGPDVVTRATGLVSLQIGAQKYLPPSLLKTPVRPFLGIAVGVLIGSQQESQQGVTGVSTQSSTMAAFGVEPGLGVDFLIAHRFMLGTKGSYRLVTDFPDPLGGKKNYSAFALGVSLSWLFGRGFGG